MDTDLMRSTRCRSTTKKVHDAKNSSSATFASSLGSWAPRQKVSAEAKGKMFASVA